MSLRVCLRFNLTVFRGSFFMILLQIQSENFFYRLVNIPASQSLSLSWYLLVQLLPFTANISSFETVAKRGAILNPVPKQ